MTGLESLLDVVATGAGVLAETDWTQCWYDRSAGPGWLYCFNGPYFEQIGRAVVVMLLGGFYTTSLYWYTRSLYPPAVILTLFGGLLVFGAPAPVAAIGGLIVTVALALAYLSIYRSRGQL